jgi:hypothetical protein
MNFITSRDRAERTSASRERISAMELFNSYVFNSLIDQLIGWLVVWLVS